MFADVMHGLCGCGEGETTVAARGRVEGGEEGGEEGGVEGVMEGGREGGRVEDGGKEG